MKSDFNTIGEYRAKQKMYLDALKKSSGGIIKKTLSPLKSTLPNIGSKKQTSKKVSLTLI
ncbi:MAG: hypothetical protein WAU01_17195 [Saprospiraceae bacterium]